MSGGTSASYGSANTANDYTKIPRFNAEPKAYGLFVSFWYISSVDGPELSLEYLKYIGANIDDYVESVRGELPLIARGGLQQNGGIGLDATIKTIGVVNDALGAAYSTTEAIAGGGIILTNKLNKASNLMNDVKIIKNVPAIGVVGTVSDALDVGLDVYNGDYGKVVLKGGVLILKNTIRFSSPVGFAVITLIDLGISAYDLYNDVNDD